MKGNICQNCQILSFYSLIFANFSQRQQISKAQPTLGGNINKLKRQHSLYSVNIYKNLMRMICIQLLSVQYKPQFVQIISQQMDPLLYSSGESYHEQIPIEESQTQKLPKHHLPILISDIDSLYKARDRLRQFSAEIGPFKYAGIRRDVVEHCDKIKINLSQHLTFQKVEKMVKNRIQKMIKNKRIKKNWSQEDVLILIWIVSKYCDTKGISNVQRDLNSNDWNFIADHIPGVKGENCMFKWLSLKKNNLSDNNWSEKESALLDKIVKKYGEEDWPLVSQKLYYANSSFNKIYRCPKQCRQHWNCYLNPKLKKGPWSKEEDELLLRSVQKNSGQKRWAQMVKSFNGRTENALKNRFTLIIDKETKIHANGKSMTEIQLIDQYLQRTFVQQFVSIKHEVKDEEIDQKNKVKQMKKQKDCEYSKRQVRTSLRRRHSTRTLGQRKPLYEELMVPEEINLKIEEQPEFYHQIYYPSQINDPAIQGQYSEPCHPYVKPESHIIYEEEQMHLTSEDRYKESHQIQQEPLPQLKDIKVVPFKLQMLSNFKFSNIVPCILTQKKLTKLN